jgi:hypothetical protein
MSVSRNEGIAVVCGESEPGPLESGDEVDLSGTGPR